MDFNGNLDRLILTAVIEPGLLGAVVADVLAGELSELGERSEKGNGGDVGAGFGHGEKLDVTGQEGGIVALAEVRRGQRRWSRSKSSETGSPFGGTTSTVAEPEAKSSTEKSNWRVAPVRVQPPSSEQMKLGWPEEEKGLSIWSSLET